MPNVLFSLRNSKNRQMLPLLLAAGGFALKLHMIHPALRLFLSAPLKLHKLFEIRINSLKLTKKFYVLVSIAGSAPGLRRRKKMLLYLVWQRLRKLTPVFNFFGFVQPTQCGLAPPLLKGAERGALCALHKLPIDVCTFDFVLYLQTVPLPPIREF